MGVAFKDLIVGEETSIKELGGKIFVVDAYNMLYQFLSSIRSRDGSLLMDSKGSITSHLVGLFSRTTNLMINNLKLAFVFDGKPPALKEKERMRRREIKVEAKKQYEKAKEKGDTDLMKKYASRTSVLIPEMLDEAKKLIKALGLPVIQAPSEGEAQAAHIVKKGKAYAVVSQDFDSLLYGSPLIIKNLSILGKRKKADKLSYAIIKPELINLSEALNNLNIDNDQLIAAAMLVGTDYNIGGIKGIGPKNALSLVKKYKKDFDSLFKEVEWDKTFDFKWTEIYYLIKKMPVTDDYEIKFKDIDEKKIFDLLVKQHDFSEERVNNTIQKLLKEKEAKQQKSLAEF